MSEKIYVVIFQGECGWDALQGVYEKSALQAKLREWVKDFEVEDHELDEDDFKDLHEAISSLETERHMEVIQDHLHWIIEKVEIKT